MHLFLYRTSKHKQRSMWDRTKVNEASTRGAFDLELIRTGLKRNYTMYGSGTHPLQELLAIFSLESRFKGHIIEVADKSLATWLKLHYDRIGRPGTDFVGSYSNIDLDEVNEFLDKAKILRDKNKHWQAIRHHLVRVKLQVESFLQNETHFVDLPSDIGPSSREYLKTLVSTSVFADARYESNGMEFSQMRKEIEQYLDDRKL